MDEKRPKQVNLRRAVSSAYYALFHLLIANAVLRLMPREHGPLRDQMSRAFQHGEMRQICEQFSREPTPPKLMDLLGAQPSAELRSVARAFLYLQEHRLLADYDPGLRLARSEAEAIVNVADQAFADWNRIPVGRQRDVFLTSLAFGARWNRTH